MGIFTTTTSTMKAVLLTFLVFTISSIYALPAKSCTEQAACLRVEFHEVEEGSGSFCSNGVQRVCLYWNNDDTDSCIKSASDTISHTCPLRGESLGKECVKMLTLRMEQPSHLLELRMDLDVLENTMELWPLDQKSQLEPVPILEMFAERRATETKENVSGNSKSNLVKMMEPQE